VAALLEGLPHAAWLVGLADQRVLAANGLAAQLFGCEREALVGEAVLSLASSPEDLAYWAGVAPGITEALQTDTVLALPDGRMHASRSIRPWPWWPAKPAAHALVMLADRSAERQLETEREALLAELQATLEATADGILVTDLQGRVQAFNRRLAELWGMPAAMLLANDDAAVQAWMLRSVTEPEAYSRACRRCRRPRSSWPVTGWNCTPARSWSA
jgi:PAS domain-containing protein